ncbi:hypothetical protein [Nocardia sp. NPDC051832]|uniref:hypothetical protein n=1 Tax=Nocardia sp. NPDC051832 TaxID=3155673 RepID=UPI00343DBD0D
MKRRVAWSRGLLVAAVLMGSGFAAGAASAAPKQWTVVVVTDNRQVFEVRDQASKEGAEKLVLDTCIAASPQGINLGSTVANGHTCRVQIYVKSGECAVLMSSSQGFSRGWSTNRGYPDDLLRAEYEARMHNLREYPSSSSPKMVWSGCQN